MIFGLRDHQGKGAPYAQALVDAGHEIVSKGRVDFVLIDYDLPHAAYNRWHDIAPVIVYPHGFSTTWVWDIVGDPYPVQASFVPGPGQWQLLSEYGYPSPTHVVGWPGPNLTPKPRKCETVLFAPHHPLGSGYMNPQARTANCDAFQALLREPFDLVVRYVGTLEENGIWREDGVAYIQSVMGEPVTEGVDVVVAGGSYAAHSLSAGLPVVMYDQDREWQLESETSSEVITPEGWEERREFTRYPYNLGPPYDATGVCQEAAANPDVSEWRERFMPAFDGPRFAQLVKESFITC